MKRIDIVKVIPNPSDATSFYRGEGPIARMQQAYPELNFEEMPQRAAWYTLMKYRIAFFQRPSTPLDVALVQECYNLGIKIWVDYDDHLFALNKDNKAFTEYERRALNVRAILRLANIITVSTEYLKGVYAGFATDVRVVPNALDLQLIQDEPVPGRHKFVTWRGGDGHLDDLMEYKDAIIQAAQENPDWTFQFIGTNPTFITKHIRHNHIAHTDVITYLDKMQRLSPAIHMVPLSDNPFNRGRSHAAWLEATMAGAAVLSPNFDEWVKSELFKEAATAHYGNSPGFFYALDHLMKHPEAASDMVAKNWAYIKENLSLLEVNKLRLQVVQDLLGVS